LHESSRGLELGPPKTVESVRRISLPPFLVVLLEDYLTTHTHQHMFVSPDRMLYRRSNFSRRAMRPAADGTISQARPAVQVQPIKPGLTFHGLRHSHKTWMIADQVPEIAQALRLGHVLDGDTLFAPTTRQAMCPRRSGHLDPLSRVHTDLGVAIAGDPSCAQLRPTVLTRRQPAQKSGADVDPISRPRTRCSTFCSTCQPKLTIS
jgi:hypothetical protein